jgi:hypothetical protein
LLETICYKGVRCESNTLISSDVRDRSAEPSIWFNLNGYIKSSS